MSTNEQNQAVSGSRGGSTPGSTGAASGSRNTGSTSGTASGSGVSQDEAVHPHGFPSSLKLPTFWVTRPEHWFIQVESAFRNRYPPITSDIVRFDCVIGALPNEVLEKVEHVITGVPQVGGRYAALQNALIESYGRSTAQKQDELIKLTVSRYLGNLKPTDFLMKVRALSGSEYEAVERVILLNALPSAVRTVLSNSKAANNKRLALEANQILEQHMLFTASAGAVYSLDDHPDEVLAIRTNARGGRDPQPQARARLCARFGDCTYTCHGGDCPRRFEPLLPRPAGSGGQQRSSGNGNGSQPRASGNGRAGR